MPNVGEAPKINPRAAEPPYRQIAAWLRGRIEAGEFRPGEDPLPSEKDLQETFEVSRDTAEEKAHSSHDKTEDKKESKGHKASKH